MIIGSSSIGMESTRLYTSVRMDAASLNRSGGINNFLTSLNNLNSQVQDENKEETEENTTSNLENSLSDIQNRFESLRAKSLSSPSKREADAITRIKTECLQYLLMWLFGRHGLQSDTMHDYSDDLSTPENTVSMSIPTTTVTETFTRMHYYSETEETSFETTGKVVTADGRQIDFNLSLSMSRSFTEYYEQNYETTYSLCDPLVINLDTNIANVSDQKFKFDIDCDGTIDEISRLSSSSGYLALDLNDDGIINDGSELFGTKSGDGFKDLAAYDSDGNGWIDEADAIWKSLKIYVQNDDGTDSLYSLSEKDIGAIFLGNVSTDFALNDQSSNQTNALIRQTGIFLYENGNVGTIQHVDMAKAEYSA